LIEQNGIIRPGGFASSASRFPASAHLQSACRIGLIAASAVAVTTPVWHASKLHPPHITCSNTLDAREVPHKGVSDQVTQAQDLIVAALRRGYPLDTHDGKVHQFNLSVERQ